ncbi:class I adenylate-forming enzyme family protein [Tenuibacillus multivorans]|uniref:Feruloyl-CoA synthase n=1 Tax=Tenuibacillus multivorans TaxID=237069 RepID=A0A1H0DCA1_9BACI|nr:AMP-binding protein [Tenuibacillus multivorans]GEL76610.1 fatty-acid CoA ligase [Tenuibacillus multivorans]SDN67790.1 feruloyl-CoA synthase [Tenuibacillus multivorans]
MNISKLLSYQSRKFPNHEAIVTPTERLTYQEWEDTVNQLSSQLKQLGFKSGDKHIIHMPNTKEFMFLYVAVLRLKGIVIPNNAKLTTSEIEYILQHSEAQFFATHEWLFDQSKPIADHEELICLKTGEKQGNWLSLDDLLVGQAEPIDCDSTEDDEASILYTSGTTGNPKGVLFTHRNILTVATMICIEMNMNKDSRILHMMPLSHSAPLHLFMGAGLYVGATHVLTPTFTPELLLKTVEKERTTHFFGAPVAYIMKAKRPDIDQYDLTSMQYWVYGGAPLGKAEVELVKDRFSTEDLMCVYGLTEAGPNGTLLEAREHDHKSGSIGQRAALNCEIRLVDENSLDEPGEIILRGEGNMKGYYKAPEKTKETIKGGWLYTGDIAKRDEDGYFWVIDRKKDVIISGGVNIYPSEVEKILMTHPDIEDVAIVGVPHPEWGESAKAFVVLNDDVSNVETTCKQFLQDKVAIYKIPHFYEVLEALPRNATGKLLKNQLREQEGRTV